LENAPLENAAGILVNFTGGDDLGLFEIESTLMHLQERSGNRAEIVMGVTYDKRMQDRVQVILVVTGLGGLAIEQPMVGVVSTGEKLPELQDAEVVVTHRQIDIQPIPPSAAHDLDLPSFLRKPR
jgi:cell division protein FtsZ